MVAGELLGKPDKIAGGVTCDGLASRAGKVEILLGASCYRNGDNLRQLWASLGSKASPLYIILVLNKPLFSHILLFLINYLILIFTKAKYIA